MASQGMSGLRCLLGDGFLETAAQSMGSSARSPARRCGGCGGFQPDSQDDRLGSATLEIPLTVPDIDRVEVVVSAPDLPAPITADLTVTGRVASGLVFHIPVGVDRLFEVNAYRGQELLCQGSALAEIQAQNRTQVHVVLQCLSASEQTGEAAIHAVFNFAPFIRSAHANTKEVPVGESVKLRVDAADLDEGDSLSILWTSTAGSFDWVDAPTVTWTAPLSTGVQTITVTVWDNNGASASLDMTLEVI